MATGVLDVRGVEGALLRYRVVAIIVSVLLVLLFAVGLPLEFAAGHKGVDAVVGTAHGIFFYPLYIVVTLDLTRRVRMTPVQLVLTVLAGTVPLASFYAERRTTEYVRARQAALSTAADAPVT
jgi:integral membrane protein